MKLNLKYSLFSAFCAGHLIAIPVALAASDYAPGRILSDAERAALKPQGTVTIGKRSLTIIQASTADSPTTIVVNSTGVIGSTKNELLISNITTSKVKAVLQTLAVGSVSTVYYDHMNITALRFASLQAAVSAKEALAPLLPHALFDVPVQYAVPTAR